MNGARSGSSRRFRLLRWSRRISQALFVGLFLYLFISTDYSGSDTINQAVNVLFRIDPLLALVTMLAARTVIALMAPALAGGASCHWWPGARFAAGSVRWEHCWMQADRW
jgi:hypothetical protein